MDSVNARAVEARPFVVGLGASAGGLEALERFFAAVPQDTGFAFVVVQHLSPDFKSLMDDILSRRTSMKVVVAQQGAPLEPNTVLLNPPKLMLSIRDGRVQLDKREPGGSIAHPIDHFFSSLAAEHSGRCAAIVLSGTGTDGARGLIDVHRAGGLTIAQDSVSAGFDGMPEAAAASGEVDLRLAPDAMPAAVCQFASQGTVPERESTEPHTAHERLTGLLRNAYGVDFSEYKLPTVQRRIDRRIRASGAGNLDSYASKLETDPAELDALYRDLLIGVTQFFRDPEAYEQLAKHLGTLVANLGPTDELRAWAVGCASGEEAYSLAIVLREVLDAKGLKNAVRIFATDIHREAVRIASSGYYDEASLVAVSPQRREHFFVAKGGGAYQIAPVIRSSVVFAVHNALQDVPFNRLDLITCRNLLIYLKPSAQRRMFETFQASLKPQGLLFLGSSESVFESPNDFTVVDPHWKIFRTAGPRRFPQHQLRATANLVPAPSHPGLPLPAWRPIEQPLLGTYDAVLEAVVPPSILVDSRRELVQTFGGASALLRVPEGRSTLSAVELLASDLRVAVTGALERVFAEHTTVRYRGLKAEQAGKQRVVDLTAREIVNRRTGDRYALLTFEEPAPGAPEPPAVEVPADQLSRDRVQALESELRVARENLQTTIEELETSNEELQATNEELMASNEELQTTNEELHSVNQELFTVNSEFQHKIAELTQLTTDMDLLLASTEVHTLFLDRELRVRRFTPLMADVFHLMPSDTGRRIDSFNHSLRDANVFAHANEVLSDGRTYEQQVRGAGDRWFLLRMLPYRRGTLVDGVVVTLVDITSLKRFELEAQTRRDQLSSILANSPDPVWIRDREGRFVVADDSFRKLTGRDPTGLKPEHIFSADVAAALTRDDPRILGEGVTVQSEDTIPTPEGSRTFLSVKFPMRDAAGHIWGLGGIQTDVTPIKRAEAAARDEARRRDHFLATLSHELRNPLAAILNASRVLAHGPLPAEKVEQWHRVQLERALHMTRLVDDLLDVARLTQNKLVMKPAPLDLDSTCKGVVDEVSPEYEARGVKLVCRVEAGLPVLGDATRLHQLQVNLLTNAVRHTPSGGEVTYSVRRGGDVAEICVEDKGAGIAPEMFDKIFELFVQGDKPGSRGTEGGLGVGLALVRRIAELHGGTVSVASRGPGTGATFTVRLPLAVKASVSASPAPQLPRDRPRSVLIVDDDSGSRDAMATLLEFDDIKPISAASGAEALEALSQGARPDLVLLDIGLPNMDGFEVCKRIRAMPGGDTLLVVALTGFGQDSDREATRSGGFDGHLTKPVDVPDVYAAYAECVARTGKSPEGTNGVTPAAATDAAVSPGRSA